MARKAVDPAETQRRNRVWYLLNKERVKKQSKAWYAANPERVRNNVLMRDYGLTSTEYDDILRKQNGRCAICKNPPMTGKRKRLHVDHDHQTGRVRGLLCHGCNTGIGNLKESPDVLRSALVYLSVT